MIMATTTSFREGSDEMMEVQSWTTSKDGPVGREGARVWGVERQTRLCLLDSRFPSAT